MLSQQPLVSKYGTQVGEEEIRVHTAADTRYLPFPTPMRALTTTETSAETLLNLLSPSRAATLRSQRWLYKRSEEETRMGMDMDMGMGTENEATGTNTTTLQIETTTLADHIFGGTDVTGGGTLREEHGITLDASIPFDYERSTMAFGDSGGRSPVAKHLTLERLRTIQANLGPPLRSAAAANRQSHHLFDIDADGQKEADERRSLQVCAKFFHHLDEQIVQLVAYSEQMNMTTPLLSTDAVRRILHRMGLPSLNMTMIRTVMAEVKHLHREGDARARLVYQLRTTYPQDTLSAVAVRQSGMDVKVAAELRKAMDVDHLGELGQSCVVAANKTRARRREMWGERFEQFGVGASVGAGVGAGVGTDVGVNAAVDFDRTVHTVPGNLNGKFARLSGKLLMYEPLCLRLRDLWEGRLDYPGTHANFLVVLNESDVEKRQLSFSQAQWTTILDGKFVLIVCLFVCFCGFAVVYVSDLFVHSSFKTVHSASFVLSFFLPHFHIFLLTLFSHSTCTHFAHIHFTSLTRAGDSFDQKLPMELKEFSTIEKRRRTRARTQLWNVWMPEQAHICEDWAEERWDIVRRATEKERLIRDKEGFRNLDDESELPLEEQAFHRYFQTVTRRMHTYVPPHSVNFDPPRWSPDVVAAARSHNIAMPPNRDDIEIDTSAPSSNMAETLNIKVVDAFVPSHAKVNPRKRPRIPRQWEAAVATVTMDIREHVASVLRVCRAQSYAFIHGLCVESMVTLVQFVQQVRLFIFLDF